MIAGWPAVSPAGPFEWNETIVIESSWTCTRHVEASAKADVSPTRDSDDSSSLVAKGRVICRAANIGRHCAVRGGKTPSFPAKSSSGKACHPKGELSVCRKRR